MESCCTFIRNVLSNNEWLAGCKICFDFFFAKTAGSRDGDVLLLAGCLVFCTYIQDTVGIDVEGYFNLRHATTSGCYAIEVELADALVLACHAERGW